MFLVWMAEVNEVILNACGKDGVRGWGASNVFVLQKDEVKQNALHGWERSKIEYGDVLSGEVMKHDGVKENREDVREGQEAMLRDVSAEVQFEVTVRSLSDVRGNVSEGAVVKDQESHEQWGVGIADVGGSLGEVHGLWRLDAVQSIERSTPGMLTGVKCHGVQSSDRGELGCEVAGDELNVQGGLRRYRCKYVGLGCTMETVLQDKGVKHEWICCLCKRKRALHAVIRGYPRMVQVGHMCMQQDIHPLVGSDVQKREVDDDVVQCGVADVWADYEAVMCQLIAPSFVLAVKRGAMIRVSEFETLIRRMRVEVGNYGEKDHRCHFLARENGCIIAKFRELIGYGWEIIEQQELPEFMIRCSGREHMRSWIPKHMIGKYRRMFYGNREYMYTRRDDM